MTFICRAFCPFHEENFINIHHTNVSMEDKQIKNGKFCRTKIIKNYYEQHCELCFINFNALIHYNGFNFIENISEQKFSSQLLATESFRLNDFQFNIEYESIGCLIKVYKYTDIINQYNILFNEGKSLKLIHKEYWIEYPKEPILINIMKLKKIFSNLVFSNSNLKQTLTYCIFNN